jgi:acetoacetyl-CoA synthetase
VTDEALTLLRRAQPAGPYSLTGYSFGGLVAFETACRLTADGETVSYLGLIDVRPPTGSFTRWELTAHRSGKLLKHLRTAASPAGPRAAAQWLRGRGAGAVDPERAAFAASSAVFDAHQLSRYDGAVTYYLAQRRLPLVGNTLSAWRRAAPHLLVTEVPGDHDNMLGGDTIEELAARISATLV